MTYFKLAGIFLLFQSFFLLSICLQGCVTKIENHYVFEGDHNSVKAEETVSAMPNNRDLVDLAGSGYGSVETKK